MYNSVERCPTGIPGFDKLCNGGLVRNNIHLVKGGPGAGKTIFLLEFLWNGLAYRENGAYLSFETDLFDVFKDASAIGWDFEKYDQTGNCRFIRLDPKSNEKDIEKQLMQLIAKNDIKRVCIDPINIFAMSMPDKTNTRQALYNLVSLLKRLNVTVIISEEAHSDLTEVSDKHSDLEFLADGVIHLHSLGIGGEADRAVRIVKMRRTKHVREPVPMQITDKGIIIQA